MFAAAALLIGLAIAGCCGFLASAPSDDLDLGPAPAQRAHYTAEALREPSGVTFHPGRGTWFVVSDDGNVAEFDTAGVLLRRHRVRKADFEGITTDPRTGRLYLAEEGPALIHEVDPATWAVLRSFPVERSHRGQRLIDPERDNLEGIAFVPDPAHPEGGTFWVTNQSRRTRPDADCPSALIEVTVPLASGRDGDPAVIRRVAVPGLADLAGVCYDARRKRLWVVSDAENRLIACDLKGVAVSICRLPGRDQEGVGVHGDILWIPQDSGGILELSIANSR